MSKYVRHFNVVGTDIDIPTSNHLLTTASRFYVDGVDGNDENDGLTPSSPLKTLDAFLKICENEQADIRCYILSAGVYEIKRASITGVAIHITGNVPNVHILFNSEQGYTAFYGCHFNVQGTTAGNINIDSTGYWYCDGGAHWFQYCNFNSEFRFYACGALIEHSKFNQLKTYWSILKLNHIIYGANYNTPIILSKESILEFQGNEAKMEALSQNSSQIAFDCEGGSVKLRNTLNLTTYKYNVCFALDGTNMITTGVRRNALESVGETGITFENGASCTNNWILYGYDTSGDSSTTLRNSVNSFNCLTLKVKAGSNFYLIDIPNPSYSDNVTRHIFFNDGSSDYYADISFSGKTMTITNAHSIRFDGVYGRNI